MEDHGLAHPEPSLLALHEITQRFSAEFAVRPFLDAYPDQVLAHLASWVRDPNLHVRRWVSEGTRPRLPWGRRLTAFQQDPTRTLPLLERLVDDPERYVRRSVANHLGDIAKDHPELAIEVGRKWLVDATPERTWVVRHGLRSLVRAGHAPALELLGYGPPAVEVESFVVAPERVRVGEHVEVKATLRARDTQAWRVDYAIWHQRANREPSPKAFAGLVTDVSRGERCELRKRHSLRPITTRRYYAGEHRVELRVNGRPVAEASFTLDV